MNQVFSLLCGHPPKKGPIRNITEGMESWFNSQESNSHHTLCPVTPALGIQTLFWLPQPHLCSWVHTQRGTRVQKTKTIVETITIVENPHLNKMQKTQSRHLKSNSTHVFTHSAEFTNYFAIFVLRAYFQTNSFTLGMCIPKATGETQWKFPPHLWVISYNSSWLLNTHLKGERSD